MKHGMIAVLMTVVLATPAFAAKLYLKEGGVIQARKVWKENGKVYVLANRDTLTSFEVSEVNMKRTFVRKPHPAKKPEAVAPQAAAAAQPGTPAAAQKPVEKKPNIALPALPKLPEKTPESLVPSSGGGGTIKQHKKNMAEKAGE